MDLIEVLSGNMSLAYLDPGSGSYIFQVLIASLVGLAFAVKTFWKRSLAFFVNLFSSKSDKSRQD